MPTAVNLRTGVELVFVGITPREAVIAAYAQERHDLNTWDYAKYHDSVEESHRFYFLGDWGVSKATERANHG